MFIEINSAEFKNILALIRSGQYAHAGEEEAIDLVFNRFQRNKNYTLLDVGCGLGGTANYLVEKNIGSVTGIDIDQASITQSKRTYPHISFLCCDILKANHYLFKTFDIIYHFNSFYAFSDQLNALKMLKNFSKSNTQLIIFDYQDLGNYVENPIMIENHAIIPHPIQIDNGALLLKKGGWKIEYYEDVSNQYERWYASLVDNIHRNENKIIAVGGEAAFKTAVIVYEKILYLIKIKQLGGVIIYASQILS